MNELSETPDAGVGGSCSQQRKMSINRNSKYIHTEGEEIKWNKKQAAEKISEKRREEGEKGQKSYHSWSLSGWELSAFLYLWLIADGMKKSANNWIKSDSENGINKKRVVGCCCSRWSGLATLLFFLGEGGMRTQAKYWKNSTKFNSRWDKFDTFLLLRNSQRMRFIRKDTFDVSECMEIWPKASSTHRTLLLFGRPLWFNFQFTIYTYSISHSSCMIALFYWVYIHFVNNNFDWWCRREIKKVFFSYSISNWNHASVMSEVQRELSNNLNISASNFLSTGMSSPVLSPLKNIILAALQFEKSFAYTAARQSTTFAPKALWINFIKNLYHFWRSIYDVRRAV